MALFDRVLAARQKRECPDRSQARQREHGAEEKVGKLAMARKIHAHAHDLLFDCGSRFAWLGLRGTADRFASCFLVEGSEGNNRHPWLVAVVSNNIVHSSADERATKLNGDLRA